MEEAPITGLLTQSKALGIIGSKKGSSDSEIGVSLRSCPITLTVLCQVGQ